MDLSQLNELDLSNIDFNNIGEAPIIVKIVLVLLLIIVIIGATYYFDTQNQLEELKKSETKELALRQDFEDKQKKAANLDAYTQQFAEMEESFGSMLKQLPDKTEIPSLVVEVSQTALAAGLESELFRPGVEMQQGFYAILPIAIKQVGTFHQIGNFVSGLAGLPRIVTIHDISMIPRMASSSKDVDDDKTIQLVLDATVRTYRYLEEGGK